MFRVGCCMKMAMARLLFHVCLTVVITSCCVECNQGMDSLFSKMTHIDEEITDIKSEFVDIRVKIKTDINIAKASLRSDLNQHIKEQVRKAMAEILQGESLEEMMRSQVVSEVRQLKHGHHQMKRQLHHVIKSLRDVEEDRETFKESIMKAERNATEVLTCSKYVVESKILQRDLEQCNSRCTEKTDVITNMRQDLKVLNETFQPLLNDVSESDKQSRTDINTSQSTTLPSTALSTSATVSYKPEEERNRIIAVPYSGSQNEFRQINIHSNSPTNYHYPPVTYVRSLAFVSKSRKLLIGIISPVRIVSSYLDTYGVKTVREGVQTEGMAVDEERELVFLTTHSPRHTISRMTTQGKHFTTIRFLVNYTSPYAIAVNTKEEKLYSCNINKLFMVTYDGRVIQTLATGSGMYAVTLDNTGALYYNDDKALMKMTWSQNSYSTTNVTTLGGRPRNLLYYRNSVYFSKWDSSRSLGVVDIVYSMTYYSLKAFDVKSTNWISICLVP